MKGGRRESKRGRERGRKREEEMERGRVILVPV